MINKDLFKSPIRRFIETKINGGAILLFAALMAMIIVNSPLKEYYDTFFGHQIAFQFGDFNLFHSHGCNMTLLDFINDALMTVFFFSVGLEIKREVLVGELSTPRKAMLPVIAACGGMIVPILIFHLLIPGGEAARGAAIPMATDIAFSLGVLSLLGKRVPLSLKIFLTAFAVVDDIGGIIVIAACYSSHLVLYYLLWSALIVAVMYIGARCGITGKLFYIVLGIIVWYLFLNSGIHPTIAGVIVAFTIPTRPKVKLNQYSTEIRKGLESLQNQQSHHEHILSNSEISILKYIETASDKAISPLQSFEDNLHPLVNYIVMPLFAFANANISFDGFGLGSIGGVTISVFTALVFGKLIGIFSFTWLSIKTGLLSMPERMNVKNLLGVSMLGGIGFTVSLFIANLSYAGLPGVGAGLLNEAKLGIVFGSIFAGITGTLYLHRVLKMKHHQTEPVKKATDA